MKKIKAAIVGANGYTGFELLRILARHPQIEPTHLISRSNAGSKISDMYPALAPYYGDRVFDSDDLDKLAGVDAAITALPHTAGAEIGGRLLDMGLRIVDLSADFRYDDVALYERTYNVTHPRPDLNREAVYGLSEVYRDKIKTARLVGNPGCYTTCAILPLLPLIKCGVIDKNGIIIDAKSGITGAGRKGDVTYSFCENDDNFKAYSVVGHRHTTEIEEQAGTGFVSFTPHLLPVKRGILSTLYVRLLSGKGESDVAAAYDKYYSGERFVRACGNVMPELKWVRGSNCCAFGWKSDERTGLMKIVSCLDNLIKGASGQAVQNLNIMFGFDEDCGLDSIGEYL